MGYLNADTTRHGDFYTECFGNDQNIGKQDSGIERISSYRLQGTFGDTFGMLQELQEILVLGLFVSIVFRQMSSRLSKQPYRCLFDGLSQCCTNHQVIELR